MKYPDFFNTIETITLQDDLSNFLGTFENGVAKIFQNKDKVITIL